METKTNPIEFCEFKFAQDHYGIEGYGNRTDIEDLGGDTIHQGAFEKTLKDRSKPILMRFEHLRYHHPGKWLNAREDEKGLYLEGELTKGHSIAEDARASMKHGVLNGLSIGFIPVKFEQKANGGRDLYEVDVVEVSLTANPMNEQSLITSFKSDIQGLETVRDFEGFLRDSGVFSKSMATMFISQFKKSVLGEPKKVDEQNLALEIADIKSKLNGSRETQTLINLIHKTRI